MILLIKYTSYLLYCCNTQISPAPPILSEKFDKNIFNVKGLKKFSLDSRIAQFIVKYSFTTPKDHLLRKSRDVEIIKQLNSDLDKICKMIFAHTHGLTKTFFALYPDCDNEHTRPPIEYTALILSIEAFNETTYDYTISSYANIFSCLQMKQLDTAEFDKDELADEAKKFSVSAKQLNIMVLTFFMSLDWNLGLIKTVSN